MRQFSLILICLALVSCATKTEKDSENWTSIFNGEDLSGWTVKISGYPLGENFNNTFIVEDGVLKASYIKYDTFNGEFGHIFYNQLLSSYKLRLKYRFTGEQIKKGPGWAFRNN